MKMIQSESKKLVSIMAVFFAVLFGMMANGCGGGGGGTTTDTTVAAPGAPTITNIEGTIGQILSATVTWTAPTTGGKPTKYNIYHSITAGSVFDPANLVGSIPAVEGQTTYQFIDNDGLLRNTDTYWVVAAENTTDETPSTEVMYTPGGGAGGEVVGYGNNFAAAMIFADGYGINGDLITGSWTTNLADIDTNTGFRPTADEKAALIAEQKVFPYFDPDTTYIIPDDPTNTVYYQQQTVSTWQGEWKDGSGTPQEVNAAWGDNLVSQSAAGILDSNSIIRIEMVLTKALDTIDDANMTSYTMKSLKGTKYAEMYGTDNTTYENNESFVFATNARLKIEKLDENNNSLGVVENQPLFTTIPDGPGKFAAEVTVAGKVAYGYIWILRDEDFSSLPQGEQDAVGKWRITFSLDNASTSVLGTDNTLIKSITLPDEGDEGVQSILPPVRVDDRTVYVDIMIH